MRWVGIFLVLLGAVTWLAGEIPSGPIEPRPTDWRRTTNGWERLEFSPRPAAARREVLHPAIVGMVESGWFWRADACSARAIGVRAKSARQNRRMGFSPSEFIFDGLKPILRKIPSACTKISSPRHYYLRRHGIPARPPIHATLGGPAAMRLTMRSMLAYMDGLLSAEDSQDISKKIEESKFATDLFHKIRDCMRRIRLAAPSLSDQGTGPDANTVAEYLDNALHSEQVPEFEEACLTSEIYLAEVAACHQILSLVLAEPAEIEPASRERMYQLTKVPTLAEEERSAAAEAASMLAAEPKTRREPPASQSDWSRTAKPPVPDYLRESGKYLGESGKRRRLLPTAAVLLIAGGLAGLAVLLFEPFAPGTPGGNLIMHTRNWLSAGFGDHASRGCQPQRRTGAGQRKIGQPRGWCRERRSCRGGKRDRQQQARRRTGPESGPAGAACLDPCPSSEPRHLGGDRCGGETGRRNQASPANAPLPKSANAPPPPLEIAAGRCETGVQTGHARQNGLPGVASAKRRCGPGLRAHVNRRCRGGRGGGAPAKRVGRFISSDRVVLLTLVSAAEGWRYVTPDSFLDAKQPLLALPTYRPRVVLPIGVTLEFSGGTRAELLADAKGQPGVDVT